MNPREITISSVDLEILLSLYSKSSMSMVNLTEPELAENLISEGLLSETYGDNSDGWMALTTQGYEVAKLMIQVASDYCINNRGNIAPREKSE